MKIGRLIGLLVAVGVLAFIGLNWIRSYNNSLDRQREALHARVLPSGGPDEAQVNALSHQAVALEPTRTPTKLDYVADVNATIARVSGASPAMLVAIRDTLASLPGAASDAVETVLHRNDVDPKARGELKRVEELLSRRAAAERRHADDERAYLRASLAAYQQHGHRDPKWDAAARKALTLLIDDPPSATQPLDEPGTAAGIDLLNKAFNVAYCSDQLLHRVQDRYTPRFHAVENEGEFPDRQAMGPRSMAIAASTYPTLWKVDLYDGKVSPALLEPGAAGQMWVTLMTQGVEYSKADLEAFFASDAFTPNEKYRWVQQYLIDMGAEARMNAPSPATKERKGEFEAIDSMLAKHLPGRVEPLLLKGAFWLQWAWDAGGRGDVRDVSPRALQVMRERLQMADAALEEAWKLDPSDPRAATLMLDVKLGEQADLSQERLWFDRAIQNDPDNYAAYYRMLTYLEPFWFGSREQALQFAYFCRGTHDFRAKLPLLVAEAHASMARFYNPKDLSAYLSQPEVGNDIHDVFERYLALYPDDRTVRTQYCCLAALSHRWADANQQFHLLGDNPTPGVFEAYDASYENLQQQVAHNAGKASSGSTPQ